MTVAFPQPTMDWRQGLMCNARGAPLGNLRNVLFALRQAPEWHDVLAYDVFACRVMTLMTPPWGGRPIEQWNDLHDDRACEWMQLQEIPATLGVVGRAVQTVAREDRVHPVCEYIEAKEWDGRSRIDTWLSRYLGVEESPYVRAIGPRFLISAVARVEQPGCQVDHLLVLEGPQGTGKSSALQTLARPWFTDRISNLGGKDAAMEIAGTWIVEIAELDAILRAGPSTTKAFISRSHDRFRPPYGKHVVDRPRQCVFAATINPTGGYLKDPSGARRFWPVTCGHIDLEALKRDNDQLWAEAYVRFQPEPSGGSIPLRCKRLRLQSRRRDSRTDAWYEDVSQWLAGRHDVSVGEVLLGALGIRRDGWSQAAQNRVAKILVYMGFERYRPGKKGQSRTPRYHRLVSDQYGEDQSGGQTMVRDNQDENN